METKRAWIYCRVNCAEDRCKELLKQQHTLNFLIDNNWELVGFSSDRSLVPGKLERRGLETVIKAAQNRKMDILVIHSISSISREPLPLLTFMVNIQDCNVDVYCYIGDCFKKIPNHNDGK